MYVCMHACCVHVIEEELHVVMDYYILIVPVTVEPSTVLYLR